MPKGTEDHVGFFVPQSKHTSYVSELAVEIWVGDETHFVCRLALQLFEQLLRLSLGRESHMDSTGRSDTIR